MANYWKQPGIARKGWTLLDVIDIREDGQSESDTDYETCMMCGNEKIRYVHVVEHSELSSEFRVYPLSPSFCGNNLLASY